MWPPRSAIGRPGCDANGRVLREDGSPISGLYAAGNTMASWTGHVYPGPGSPIGSCMAFGYIGARHIVSLVGAPA